MRPRRRSSVTDSFTFGGRIPGIIGILLVLILLGSVLAWRSPALRNAAAFHPGAVLGGEIWRLVSWVFVAPDPFTLLFGGIILWQFGSQLSYVWSERTFLNRFLGYTVGAAVVATIVALVWPGANLAHLGPWPTVNALLVTWALMYPSQQVNIWGVLPLTGKTFALLILFGTLLYGIFAGFGAFLLHFAAIAIAWGLSTRGLAWRKGSRRMQGWWADRETRRKSKHLKVVDRDRDRDGADGDKPRWMN